MNYLFWYLKILFASGREINSLEDLQAFTKWHLQRYNTKL